MSATTIHQVNEYQVIFRTIFCLSRLVFRKLISHRIRPIKVQYHVQLIHKIKALSIS